MTTDTHTLIEDPYDQDTEDEMVEEDGPALSLLLVPAGVGAILLALWSTLP